MSYLRQKFLNEAHEGVPEYLRIVPSGNDHIDTYKRLFRILQHGLECGEVKGLVCTYLNDRPMEVRYLNAGLGAVEVCVDDASEDTDWVFSVLWEDVPNLEKLWNRLEPTEGEKPEMEVTSLEASVEAYMRQNTSLYRHYSIPAVQESVKQWTGVVLTHEQAVAIVQRLRDEFGMGPIAWYNKLTLEEQHQLEKEGRF